MHFAGSRVGECRRILNHIAEHVAETRPNVILMAGDVFDRRSTPEERLYLASFLSALADVAPVEIIPGNHDDAEDVELFDRLEDPHVHVRTSPIIVGYADLALAFLPWPRLDSLAAAMGPQASIADRRAAARAALIDILRGFRSDPGLRPGAPSLLVAHFPVLGASVDSGQPVATSDELALSADELLECGAAGAAMGHVHLRQQMRSGDGRPVWYAGAPFRNTFGEATGGKGGLLWEWEGAAWKVTPWDVPARRMLLLDVDLETDTPEDGGGTSLVYLDVEQSGRGEPPADVDGAEIRLRAHFAPEFRECAMALAAEEKSTLLRRGAHSVVIDPQPLMVQRTRCAEIQTARTTREKVAAWARATGLDVPEGAAAKLAALEQEVGP